MNEFISNPYFELFSKQSQNQFNIGTTSCKQRISKLNALKKAIETTYRQDIQEALSKDLGKPVVETELTEIYAIIGDIKHAKQHLKQWMKKHSVETPLSMLGSSSYITLHFNPKGFV